MFLGSSYFNRSVIVIVTVLLYGIDLQMTKLVLVVHHAH